MLKEDSDESERAVSPVIGVILMVAITVILAAVIAAFVLDIGNTSQPVQGNVEVTSDDILVTASDNMDGIEIGPNTGGYNTDGSGNFDPDADSCAEAADNDEFSDGLWDDPDVGESSNVDGADCEGETLQLIGTNDDGGEQIIFDDDL